MWGPVAFHTPKQQRSIPAASHLLTNPTICPLQTVIPCSYVVSGRGSSSSSSWSPSSSSSSSGFNIQFFWGESVESWTQLGFKQTSAKWHWNAFHHLLHAGVDLGVATYQYFFDQKKIAASTQFQPFLSIFHQPINQNIQPLQKKNSQQKTMPTISPTASPWHVGSQRIGAIKDMVLAEVTE